MHLSDLHFGSDLFNQRRHNLPLHNGHDPLVAGALRRGIEKAFAEADGKRRFEAGSVVVVSGDLTQFGTNTQHVIAMRFLHGASAAPGVRLGKEMGLSLDEAPKVAGNHDHWDSRPPLPYLRPNAFNRNVYPWPYERDPGKVFSTAWVGKPLSAPNLGFQVRFLGIDSNGGFRDAAGCTNLHAEGRLHPDCLRGLEAGVRQAEQTKETHLPEVRVLLHHHACYLGGTKSAAQPLCRQCFDALRGTCRALNVRVILTGHFHRHDVFPIDRRSFDPEMWELRCGTTALASERWLARIFDRIHRPARSRAKYRKTEVPPCFWRHELTLTDGGVRLRWTPSLYLWNENDGFELASKRDPADSTQRGRAEAFRPDGDAFEFSLA